MESEVNITRSKASYIIAGLFLLWVVVIVLVGGLSGKSNGDNMLLIVSLLIAAPFLYGACYYLYLAFKNKPVIIINTEGISYLDEMIPWRLIKTYKTLRDCRDECCVDFLILTFENNDGRLEIFYSDLNTDFQHLRKCIRKFSTNDKIIDENHLKLK